MLIVDQKHMVVSIQLKLFTKEGDWVLDPFIGSGITLEVSLKLNRNTLGIDIIPEYINQAAANIEQDKCLLLEEKTHYG